MHSRISDGSIHCRFVPHSQLWARYLAIPGNSLMTGIPGKDRSYSDEGAQLAAYIIQNVTGTAVATSARIPHLLHLHEYNWGSSAVSVVGSDDA